MMNPALSCGKHFPFPRVFFVLFLLFLYLCLFVYSADCVHLCTICLPCASWRTARKGDECGCFRHLSYSFTHSSPYLLKNMQPRHRVLERPPVRFKRCSIPTANGGSDGDDVDWTVQDKKLAQKEIALYSFIFVFFIIFLPTYFFLFHTFATTAVSAGFKAISWINLTKVKKEFHFQFKLSMQWAWLNEWILDFPQEFSSFMHSLTCTSNSIIKLVIIRSENLNQERTVRYSHNS